MDDNTQAQQPTSPTPPMGGGFQDDQQFAQDPQQADQNQGQPMGQQPVTQDPAAAQPPAQQGGGLSDIMEKDVDISELVQNAGQNQQQSQALFNMLPLQKGAGIQVDERYFVELLAGSISLTYNEKVKILENFSKLSQYQIDELIKIFEEEKGKFAELEKKHAEQIANFEKQHSVNAEETVKDRQEEEERKRREEEEQMRIMQQLQGGGGDQ